MLKKFINSTNNKGDGKMNSKNSLLRLGFAALMLCLLAATFITGCGGENPTGSSAASQQQDSSTPATNSNLPSQASGTAEIRGAIIDSSTGTTVNSTAADFSISATLIGTDKVFTAKATENKAFALRNLFQGFYLVKITDASGLFGSRTEVIDLTGTDLLKFDFSVVPVTLPSNPVSASFFGSIRDALNSTPIMAAVITVTNKATNQSYQSSTLVNGQFSLINLPEGQFQLNIQKNGFASSTIELRIGTDIWFGIQKITSVKAFVDGDNVTRNGYDLGSINLAQEWTNTGAFQGILYDPSIPVKTPLKNATLLLWYDKDPNDESRPEIVFQWLETNSLGYFSMKNLPPGYYRITKLGDTATPEYNLDNEIIGYLFTREVTPWYLIEAGKVSIVAVQEE